MLRDIIWLCTWILISVITYFVDIKNESAGLVLCCIVFGMCLFLILMALPAILDKDSKWGKFFNKKII